LVSRQEESALCTGRPFRGAVVSYVDDSTHDAMSGHGVPCPYDPRKVRQSYSEVAKGRKYWVPLTGSWRRLRSCWRSSLRSTKSMSEVLMTRRSEAA
jgi:hypothetical protein